MAGSVNKVILVGNLGAGSRSPLISERRQGVQLAHRDIGELEGQERASARSAPNGTASQSFSEGLAGVAERYLK